ncbi:MAG: hypothetical protein KDD66_01650 [Bdellovibrionales bacterium]|nr:hypothetical protein [Bdellovibrionales bacterium]
MPVFYAWDGLSLRERLMKSFKTPAPFIFRLLFAVICLSIISSPAIAEPPAPRLKLSNFDVPSNDGQKFFLGGSRGLDVSDVRLDSADDIILSQDRNNRLFKYYRGLVYLKYFNDWTGIGNYDELENERLAESMFVYHGVKSLLDYLEFSPLAMVYEDFMNELRYYKNMSTVTVDRTNSGDLTIDNADDDSDGLLRFRIGVNSRHGVEPQLRIADVLQLRHDFFGEQTLLEFRIDF